MSNLTTQADISNLSRLNDILGLIEDLQAEMGFEISSEQVDSSKTVETATKIEGFAVAPITDSHK